MKTYKLLKYIGVFLVIVSIVLIFLEIFEVSIISEYIVQKGRLFIMTIGFIFLAVGGFMQNAYEKKQ